MLGQPREWAGPGAEPVICITDWAVDELHDLACLVFVVWGERPGLGLQVQCWAKCGEVSCSATGPTMLCCELIASLHCSESSQLSAFVPVP